MVGAVVLNTAGARRADALPRSRFRWRACNEHTPSGLRSVAEVEQMVEELKDMHFTTLLINGKTPDGRCYYDTQLGTRAEEFSGLDHVEVASEACRRAGLQCLVRVLRTFAEGSPKSPSNLLKQHPEWAEYHEGEPMELSERSGDPFGCPDRREVRDYELSLIRENHHQLPRGQRH